MAIWDDALAVKNGVAEVTEFGSVKTIKCPGCGDDLRHEPSLGKLSCRSCGSIYDPYTLELDGVFSGLSKKPAREEDADKSEYQCNSCGAIILCKNQISATFCAHCGNSVLLKRRLEYEFAPESIIPFKISKEDALKNLKKYFSTSKSRPKNLINSFTEDRMMGVYVPFWLVDTKVNAELDIQYDCYSDNRARKNFSFKLKNVPFDGGKFIDNELMRAIEPYDNSELVPYSDSFLSGFYAERYDETVFEVLDSIDNRIRGYARNLIEAKKEFLPPIIKRDSIFCVYKNMNTHYGLLPVWFLNTNYNGVNCTFAVNGQTGEASGHIPVSKEYKLKKTIWAFILHLIPVACALAYASFIILDYWNSYNDFLPGLWFAFICIFILKCFAFLFYVPFFIYGHIKALRMKIEAMDFSYIDNLDPAPSVEQYLDVNITDDDYKEILRKIESEKREKAIKEEKKQRRRQRPSGIVEGFKAFIRFVKPIGGTINNVEKFFSIKHWK